jgi:hypothetical protein
VIDEAQFILVEPDTTRLGWGVVKFVALLQVSQFNYQAMSVMHVEPAIRQIRDL